MSDSNRVAAFLDGCPDPGGVLYRESPAPVKSTGKSLPRKPPSPKITQLALPTSEVTTRQLAELLGVPIPAIVRELLDLGIFPSLSTVICHDIIRQVCSRMGVTVIPAV